MWHKIDIWQHSQLTTDKNVERWQGEGQLKVLEP